MYTLLSLCGGGVRGLIEIAILIAIEDKLKSKNIKLINTIDMLAGTSTGAIIITLLTLGYSAKDILQIYLNQLPNAFQHSWSLDGLLSAKYKIEPLQQLVVKYSKDLKLSSLTKTCFIPSYNITKGKSNYFSNKNNNKDYYLADVILAATAAPTYFPAAIVTDLVSGKINSYIDGGVSANDPTLCALSTIDNKDDVFIISITSGHSSDAQVNTNNWGQLKWVQPLIGILIDANASNSHKVVKKMVKNNYFYFNCPLIKANNSLDDFSKANIDNLLLDVNNYLQTNEVIDMINQVVNKLVT